MLFEGTGPLFLISGLGLVILGNGALGIGTLGGLVYLALGVGALGGLVYLVGSLLLCSADFYSTFYSFFAILGMLLRSFRASPSWPLKNSF